jgi:hypothetical protein
LLEPLVKQFKANAAKLTALKRELAAKSAIMPKPLQLDINKNVKEYESTLAAIKSYLNNQGINDSGLGFLPALGWAGYAAIVAVLGAGAYAIHTWGDNTETMAPILLEQAKAQEKKIEYDLARLNKLGALSILPDTMEAAGKSAGGMGLLIIAGLAAYLIFARR